MAFCSIYIHQSLGTQRAIKNRSWYWHQNFHWLYKVLFNIVTKVHQNEGNAFKNRETLVTLASILKQSGTSSLEYEGGGKKETFPACVLRWGKCQKRSRAECYVILVTFVRLLAWCGSNFRCIFWYFLSP